MRPPVTDLQRWLPGPAPDDAARVQLLVFPHAGGGTAVFKEWPDCLPGSIAVRPVAYPGREARFREPPCTRVAELVDAMLPVVRPELARPYALFGHSLGAFVAYELVQRLIAEGGPLPVHLFVSAARAPHTPLPSDPLDVMPEPRLLAKLRDMGGTPERVLAEPELMKLFLPMLRADFRMSDRFERPADDPPLPMPVSAFLGTQDDHVDADKVRAWDARAGAAFSVRAIPGDHFFIQAARRMVLDSLVADLAPHLR